MKSRASHIIQISVHDLCAWLTVEAPKLAPDTIISGFASLKDAVAGDLSFFADIRYRGQLAATRASAVLIPVGFDDLPEGIIGLQVDRPHLAFEKLLGQFGFQPPAAPVGIHPTAVLGSGVKADRTRISIGAQAVIEADVQIGKDVEIGAGCYVGAGVSLGDNTKLFPNVTILEGCSVGKNVLLHSGAVIGADGFGFEFVNGRHQKIRQTGTVQIDDHVEIGANTTVDRARIGRTWIGEGTKIDNQVQIAHNVVIGKHCIIVAGVGIAGSAQIGDYVVIAAQAGVTGHVEVGSGCTIGARSGVTKSLPARSGAYLGFPAIPASEERRRLAANRKTEELLKRVKKLEDDCARAEGA